MSWILLLFAAIVQAIVFLAWAVPFPLPRVEAWQAAAFLLFFLSGLAGSWPWPVVVARRGP